MPAMVKEQREFEGRPHKRNASPIFRQKGEPFLIIHVRQRARNATGCEMQNRVLVEDKRVT